MAWSTLRCSLVVNKLSWDASGGSLETLKFWVSLKTESYPQIAC